MQEYIRERNRVSANPWALRVGIHTGPVVAGVVGKRKFAYDVWGDTVNIASRVEKACEPGRVNISAFTYEQVKGAVAAEARGPVAVPGRRKVGMYYVFGENPES
jgi:class 3 adenylate cyclase